MKADNFFNTKWLDRFQIFNTSEGFMVYDHDCDEYLHDENGDNCFSGYNSAYDLVTDACNAVLEHSED
jgi:hypothetical protein